jgi:hypothetical protein
MPIPTITEYLLLEEREGGGTNDRNVEEKSNEDGVTEGN